MPVKCGTPRNAVKEICFCTKAYLLHMMHEKCMKNEECKYIYWVLLIVRMWSLIGRIDRSQVFQIFPSACLAAWKRTSAEGLIALLCAQNPTHLLYQGHELASCAFLSAAVTCDKYARHVGNGWALALKLQQKQSDYEHQWLISLELSLVAVHSQLQGLAILLRASCSVTDLPVCSTLLLHPAAHPHASSSVVPDLLHLYHLSFLLLFLPDFPRSCLKLTINSVRMQLVS